MSVRWRTLGLAQWLSRALEFRFDHFDGFKLSGWPAWLLWGAVHIFFLISFRNRVMVAMNWLWAYWTHDQGVALIIRSPPKASSESTMVPSR